MQLKRYIRQKKTYIMLAGAYLAFILISMCVGIWYYSNMKDSVVDSTLKYNESMVQLMKSNVDAELSEISYIDYYIEIDEITQRLVNGETISENEKYDLMRLLYKLKSNMSIVDDLCIYIEDEDTVITARNVTDSRTYFESQFNITGYDYNEWRDKYLLEVRDKEFYPEEEIKLSSTVSQNIIVYKRSLFSDSERVPKVHILMMIMGDELKKNLSSIELATGSQGFIVDTKGETILSLDNEKVDFDAGNLGDAKRLFEANSDLVDIYEKSDTSNLIYVCRMDKDIILKDVNTFVGFGFLLIGLYLLFGLVLMRFSGHVIYNPIKKITKKIGWENTSVNGEYYSEMELINAKIDDFLNKEEEYKYRIEELTSYKKKTEIRSLLTGKFAIAEDSTKWKNECFLVMVVRIIDDIEEEIEGKENIIKYGILNILEDLTKAFSEGESVELANNCIAVVLNFNHENTEAMMINMQKMSKIMTDILEQEFNTMAKIAVSAVHMGTESLNLCFNEAMAALDFRFISDENEDLIRYDMVNGESMSDEVYYWPQDLDEILIHCINTGDYESIEKIINEIIDANIKNIRNLNIVNEYVYYNFLGSYLRVSSKLINYSEAKNMKYNPEKTLKENIDVIKEGFKTILSIAESKKTEHLKLLEKIESYIDEHFTENGLSLIMIADAVQVSVQYLTSYFKKHKKTTLLKYITQKRIDMAKELLKTSSQNINDIAIMVGYTDASVFNKVFKKSENITPGKYREAVNEVE